MFFQPYSDYVITRQIYNEQDFGQVYVKAWVSDASDDEAISDAQTNLELSGVEMTEVDSLGKFKYSFRLPGDPKGTGRQLRIKTVVYSDSGYTTKDVNYQVEETNLVVRDIEMLGGGGGGGTSVDYDVIQKMIDKAIDKAVKMVVEEYPQFPEIEIPKPEEVDYEKIEKLILAHKALLNLEPVLNAISGIKMPETPDLDLSEVLEAIDSIPKPDLSKLENNINDLDDSISNHDKKIDGLSDKVGKIQFPDVLEEIKKSITKESGDVRKDLKEIKDSVYATEDKLDEK